MDKLINISQSFENSVQKRIQIETKFYEKVLDVLTIFEENLNVSNRGNAHNISMLVLNSLDVRDTEAKSLGSLRNRESSVIESANTLKFYGGKVRVSPLLKESENSYFFGFKYSVPMVDFKDRLGYDLRIDVPFLFKITLNETGDSDEFMISSSHTIDFLMNVGNFSPKSFQSKLKFPSFNEDFSDYVLGFVEGYIKNNSEEVFGLF